MRLVWENEGGGRTYEVGDRFLKWSSTDLRPEAERMRWAVTFTPVPRVVDVGCSAAGSWLFTERLAGDNAVTERWKADPATAVRAIGEGLRAFHDALPVESCPFTWRVADRLVPPPDPSKWHPDHHSLSPADALAIIHAEVPPEDDLVVCHGDTCAPNTLIGDDGRWSGHVDLGAMGVGDRWADLAIATWSTQWNYGMGWEQALLDAYGIGFDDAAAAKTRYYRLLWDLSP